jgi:hypothetical protein
VHPAVRSTGAAVLSLFQNLLGLALGPFVAGMLSDQWGLPTALSLIPVFSAVAAVLFVKAAASYEAEVAALAGIRLAAEGDDAPTLPGTPAAA